jgi:acetyl-CoA synthetase
MRSAVGTPPIAGADPDSHGVPPQLTDYDEACSSFRWSDARRALDGLPGGGGLNMAHEAVDRHATGAGGQRVALRSLDVAGRAHDVSYAELRARSARFAGALERLGVGAGDRVATLLPRTPALWVSALGALRARAVFAPLFAAYGPEPVRARLAAGGIRVLVTTARAWRAKVAPLRAQLPALEHVLLVDGPSEAGARGLQELLDAARDDRPIPPTDPGEPALLHFTSGTTGAPKAALHAHEALVAQDATARLVLDLRPSDTLWCTADPGWVTGTVYGILAPLSVGARVVADEADFDAERWLAVLRDQDVSVWYTAPTALRLLSRLGDGRIRAARPPRLRFAASVGEPLEARAVEWSRDVFGIPVHDTWWQTETGAIMIANFAATELRPGSMGRPVPGVSAALVRRRADGGVDAVTEPGALGEIALRAGWPSMFRGYLGDEARTRACFADGWYLSGDLARRDADGWFWFAGRSDDVIKSAGQLVGPTEVEAALLDHAAVLEAGVIGVPDPVAGESIVAFVALRPGHTPGEPLRRELLAHARRRLGPAIAPRAIEIRPRLPKTRSGKIARRLLKARELGLPEGDLSGLQDVD